jgi:hypothetical protein
VIKEDKRKEREKDYRKFKAINPYKLFISAYV